MFALCGLALAATLLPSPAAHAGSWTYVVTGDNIGSHFTDNGGPDSPPSYSPNSPVTGTAGSSAGIYTYTIDRGNNGQSGSGCNMTATVNVQVTFTWHPDPNLPSDPPPPNVLVQESATAFWSASAGDSMHIGTLSGSAANGLGDAEYDPPNNPNGQPPVVYQTAYQKVGYSGPQPDQSYPSPVPALVSHFKSYPASGGTVTVDKRTVTAHATATISNWYYGAKVSVGYSASIHAQPYNFRQLGGVMDNGDGTLSWNYVWNSTTGTLTDINSGCTVYEYVSYDGNSMGTLFAGPPPGYAPPHPPVGPASNGKIAAQPNPTISPNPAVPGGAASAGAMNDIQDKPYSFAPTSSCVAATWTASQTYKFDDTATGEKGTVVPGPGSGPMTITRRVYSVQSPPPYAPSWYYTVNKSGSTSTPPLLITP